MKGLLAKDCMTLYRQSKFFLIVILVLAIAPGAAVTGVAMAYATMLPVNLLSMDEQSRWDQLAPMLPYTRLAIVAEKHLLGLMAVLITAPAAMLGKWAFSLAGVGEFSAELCLTIACQASAALAALAVMLPLMYRFGVEKGRMWFVLILGLATAFMMDVATGGFFFGLGLRHALTPGLCLGMALVALACMGVSVPVSVRAYEGRVCKG